MARLAAHRRDIAERPAERLPADTRRILPAQEVDALDDAIRLQKKEPAARPNHRAIIPGTENQIIRSGQAGQDFSEQAVFFRKFHLAKSGQNIAATIVSALKEACIEIGAQSDPQRS